MSTAPTPTPLQSELATLAEAGAQAAAPFIKNPDSQQKAQTIFGEINLGIALLPTLAELFHNIAKLFHHAHSVATEQAPPK